MTVQPPKGASEGLREAIRRLLDKAAESHEDFVFAPDLEALLARHEGDPDLFRAALEEIAAVPGRSVTTIIAQRALNGHR